MKKEYEEPIIEVIELDDNDSIVMSGLIDFSEWMGLGGGMGL